MTFARLVLAASVVLAACTDRVEVGLDFAHGGSAGLGGGSAESGGTAAGNGGSPGACVETQCQGRTYLCGNCIDDDNDGLIDALDPDCLGPCDDTEDSYYLGVHSDGGDRCRQDCHFDRDSGSGNDGCDWSFACDQLSVAPDFHPTGSASCVYDEQIRVQGSSCADLRTAQSQTCTDYCGPLTPNGCDCFGCCELPARSGKYVWLGSTDAAGRGSCTRDKLDDPTACQPCTPVPSCLNACDDCELCVGETAVSDACTNAEPECPGGQVSCSDPSSCPPATYCVTGCCVDAPR